MNNLLVSSGTITDGIIIAILLIFVLVGVKKGFIKSVLSFFGSLVALIVAFIFCKQFAGILDNKFDLLAKIAKYVETALMKNSKFAIELSAGAIQESLEAANVPGFMISVIMQLPVVINNTYPAGTTVATLVSPVISNYILIIISFIGLFIIFKIVLLILKIFADSIKKIKIIDIVDKLLGLAVGVVEAAVVVYVALTVISLFPSFMSKPMEGINSSKIGKYLYESDILGKALEMVIDKDKLNTAVDDIIKDDEEETGAISISIDGINYNFA
jgi:uncharacterized membrane protein required for colicin V production